MRKADLAHHLLALGATGCGKTHSIALPLLYSFMRLGYAGLIIDLKGNLRGLIRRLARACSQEHRIIEYGTGKRATPLNLMENLTFKGLSAFFENLTKKHCNNQTGNLDFHMKGVRQTADCAKLLAFLEGHLERAEPNLVLIAQMLVNEPISQELYAYFKAKVFDAENEKHANFANSVESDAFHVLFNPDSKNDIGIKDDRIVQMNFALQDIRDALKSSLKGEKP